MAVTKFQADVLKRIADSRIKSGETYVAGGLALNYQLKAPRLSHDIDVFNNSTEALHAAYGCDSQALREAGFEVIEKKERLRTSWKSRLSVRRERKPISNG